MDKIINRNLLIKSILVLIMVLISEKSYTDILHLKTGVTIDGKVISESDTHIRIRTGYGIEFKVKKVQIESIEKKMSDEDVFLEKVKEIKDGDAKGHYELGIWCKRKDLKQYAKK